MHFFALISVLLCAASSIVAVPVQRRAITCSSTNTTQLGADIESTRLKLKEIDSFTGVVDATPLFAAQLAIVNATATSNKLGSASLFPTLASGANAPPDNAVDLIKSALTDAQTQIALITAQDGNATTIILAGASTFLTKAIDQLGNLNCTTGA
ncbi:hypothetical protein B0H14DRAFT_1355086 [Mycena olivaceomarginata]|nr:hypothetical protein B0H14DRAFT_1355086 [Mycena olivaceomarginata]